MAYRPFIALQEARVRFLALLTEFASHALMASAPSPSMLAVFDRSSDCHEGGNTRHPVVGLDCDRS